MGGFMGIGGHKSKPSAPPPLPPPPAMGKADKVSGDAVKRKRRGITKTILTSPSGLEDDQTILGKRKSALGE